MNIVYIYSGRSHKQFKYIAIQSEQLEIEIQHLSIQYSLARLTFTLLSLVTVFLSISKISTPLPDPKVLTLMLMGPESSGAQPCKSLWNVLGSRYGVYFNNLTFSDGKMLVRVRISFLF